MITIDLLKGEGLPVQRRPIQMLLGLLPLIIPVLLAAVLFGSFCSDRIQLRTASEQLAKLEGKADDLDGIRNFLQETDARRQNLGTAISEVAKALPAHRQWSGLLLELVSALPEKVNLNKLEMQRQAMREQKKDKDGKPIEVIWYRYNLTIGAQCAAAAGDAPIQDMVGKLRQAPIFASRIEDIQVINQERDKGKGETASYEIACSFKRVDPK